MASDIDKADAMEGIRAIADQSGVPAFPYTYMYLYWVQFVGLISKSVANFAVVAGTMKTMGGSSYYLHNSLMARFSVAGIFVILMVFLGNFWLSLIVLGNIVLIDMELLAVMYVWNINLTNVSIILLLLSIGLAVDSCAHIAHAFATSNEVRKVASSVGLVFVFFCSPSLSLFCLG
jgi:Niemann-Pick C1 protein